MKLDNVFMAVFMMLLIVFPAAYCQDDSAITDQTGSADNFIVIDLIDDAEKWDDERMFNMYKAGFRPFSILLVGNEEEYTICLTVPMDIDIQHVDMKLSPMDERIPTDVVITLGGETIAESQGDFTGFDLGKDGNLGTSIQKYLEESQEKEDHSIPVPLVFTCQRGGKIEVTTFSVEFKVNSTKELEYTVDSETGIPQLFFWKAGVGSNPTYELQIRSDKSFSSYATKGLFTRREIIGAIYKLTNEDIEALSPEPEKTYYWGVRVVYSFGEKQCISKWETSEFTVGQENVLPVEDIEIVIDDENEIRFNWETPGNAEYFDVALNGHTIKEKWNRTFYSIDKISGSELSYLCLCGNNTLTIWAVSGNRKSEPREIDFKLEIERICPPDPDSLEPRCTNPVEKTEFSFNWEEVPGAWKYKIELYDQEGNSIDLPTEKGTQKTAEISRATTYNPWRYGGLDLRSSNIYIWRICAVPKPDPNKPVTESEWTIQMFIYQPVLLGILILYSAIGGIMGGFVRVVQEERSRAQKVKERMKIYLDRHAFLDLLVGLIMGIMFYLLINQTLSQQLNPLNIPPFNYAGSAIIGFLGGLLSYDLTRLRRALPE